MRFKINWYKPPRETMRERISKARMENDNRCRELDKLSEKLSLFGQFDADSLSIIRQAYAARRSTDKST